MLFRSDLLAIAERSKGKKAYHLNLTSDQVIKNVEASASQRKRAQNTPDRGNRDKKQEGGNVCVKAPRGHMEIFTRQYEVNRDVE